MIKRVEAQVGQFLLGCKCPVSRGIVVVDFLHDRYIDILMVFWDLKSRAGDQKVSVRKSTANRSKSESANL